MTGAAAAATAGSTAQQDDTPCWKVLTNDAFDNTVDGLYPIAVYGEAIKHLPTDVQSYSTIADVINRARQDALQKQSEGVKADPARCGFALGASGSDTTGGTSTGGGNGKGPIPGFIDKTGSDSADGFPVALIVIAVVAALLVLGGSAGFLVRRRQRHQGELEAASGAASHGDDGPPQLNP